MSGTLLIIWRRLTDSTSLRHLCGPERGPSRELRVHRQVLGATSSRVLWLRCVGTSGVPTPLQSRSLLKSVLLSVYSLTEQRSDRWPRTYATLALHQCLEANSVVQGSRSAVKPLDGPAAGPQLDEARSCGRKVRQSTGEQSL